MRSSAMAISFMSRTGDIAECSEGDHVQSPRDDRTRVSNVRVQKKDVSRYAANPLGLLLVIELLFDLLSAVADFFHRVLDLGL